MGFTVSNKARNFTYILMAIGAIALIMGIIGLFTAEDVHHYQNRFWSNLMVNSFFFFTISVGALFFFAVQYASESGWSALLKRVFEATMSFLPIGAVLILLIIIVGAFHGHGIWHWMDPHAVKHDEILQGKSPYLNIPFFIVRALVYISVFVGFGWWFRKKSLEEDQVGGTELHWKNYRKSVIFIVLFAVLSSVMGWDLVMSVTPHWYSTIFGWYVLGGFWCTAIIVMTMLTLYLKKKGFLEQVNENHIHDMGKWMFALSFLWTYLWFSQFVLYWYGNKPEPVTYFMMRIDHYAVPFWTMLVINFVLPMLFLMSRDAKRNYRKLMTLGAILLVTHWLDAFLLFMPGTVYEHWHLGFLEIGMALGFLGLFTHLTLRKLSKAPVTPQHHPFLEESVHLHT
jgi:hypothetical protein